jgi:hypothetical protein
MGVPGQFGKPNKSGYDLPARAGQFGKKSKLPDTAVQGQEIVDEIDGIEEVEAPKEEAVEEVAEAVEETTEEEAEAVEEIKEAVEEAKTEEPVEEEEPETAEEEE